ncbi:hypothetical protein CAC42_7142 [Sphaceloma murrayae]|uniref:Life-span regulatory factor-domain-containing protein n=1 Tax=Sphaceloma murrayae TaxID=2082308 RepID=A0A2K1QR54_9PEZI|nr:hypothetical protein CAC42_7142 [Sphaceloma murrayae]
MTRPGYTRSNSYGRGLLKNSRPSALKLSKSAHKTSPGSKSGGSKRNSRNDFDEDDMAALPNFCTTCEKQIITPNAALLYCSEACRRKDGNRPISACLETGFPSPSPVASFDPASYPDIVPQRSPTAARPSSIVSEDSSMYDRPGMSRADSEASKYLSQFLSASSTSPARRTPRPGYYRNPTTSSQTTLPSLSHTPNSCTSPSSSYNSVSRTAPTRPVYWSSHRHQSSTRSIDLVMPITAPASVNKIDGESSLRSQASTATAFRVAEGELTYEKKPMTDASRATPGSLKQLFAHEAMRRPPSLAYNYSSSSLSKHEAAGDD